MAFHQQSSSSSDMYSDSTEYYQHQYSSDYDDDDDDDEMEYLAALDSDDECPTLVGSDTEYKCESDSNSEASSAPKRIKTEKGKMMKKNNKPSRRVWSERDEIVILKGVAKFLRRFKVFNGTKFHEYIGKDIQVDVSTAQVSDKVSKLKRKYRKNEEKRGPNGEEPVFSKPHDQRLFELSTQAWGNIFTTGDGDGDGAGAGAGNKTTDGEGVDVSVDAAAAAAADPKLQEKEDILEEDSKDDDLDSIILKEFEKYLESFDYDLGWFDDDEYQRLQDKFRKLKLAEITHLYEGYKFDARVSHRARHHYKRFDY